MLYFVIFLFYYFSDNFDFNKSDKSEITAMLFNNYNIYNCISMFLVALQNKTAKCDKQPSKDMNCSLLHPYLHNHYMG